MNMSFTNLSMISMAKSVANAAAGNEACSSHSKYPPKYLHPGTQELLKYDELEGFLKELSFEK